MQVTIVATDPNSTEYLILEADGSDEESATAAALAQVPDGWKTVNYRRD